MATGGDLYKVSSNGGKPELILKADNDGGFAQPHFISGSKVVLVRRGTPLLGRIEAVELLTLARHRLVEGTTPQLAATGDLLFEQQGGIWATKFDTKRLSVTGVPVPIVASVRATAGGAQFSTAGDGSLAYIAGNSDTNRSLVWLDRTGKATDALQAKGAFQSPRLSPDGKRVVVSSLDGSNLNLWAYEFERGTRLRLTTTGNSRRTVWSPDGLQVAFYSTPSTAATADRGEGDSDQDLYVVPSTGGEPKKLLTRPGAQFPDAWSPDGRVLVFEEGEAATGPARRDLWVLPIGEAPRPLVVTRFYERGAVFSPDGRWLAFVTDESGRAEVYVQPFPGPGPKVAISNNGGLQPMWARDGRELFYREGGWMMAAPIKLDPFRVEAPRKLFEFPAATFNLDPNFADYDVAPDGRFLAIQADTAAADEINVVVNWTEELKRLVPTN
jgi:eukaryotic-like serine/threonine-protein kinase